MIVKQLNLAEEFRELNLQLGQKISCIIMFIKCIFSVNFRHAKIRKVMSFLSDSVVAIMNDCIQTSFDSNSYSTFGYKDIWKETMDRGAAQITD